MSDLKTLLEIQKKQPILFIGSGISKRYLNLPDWRTLLINLYEIHGKGKMHFLTDEEQLLRHHSSNDVYKHLASKLEKESALITESDHPIINEVLEEFVEEKYKSKFKGIIAKTIINSQEQEYQSEEFENFKRLLETSHSIITTNYDTLIEENTTRIPVIGNDILETNPIGSVYKIHGCVNDIDKIVITSEDYKKMEKEYELINSHLLSMFIHNPVIFLGYSISDENIQNLLNVIFKYVDPNSELGEKITNNFLIIEYNKHKDTINVERITKEVRGINLNLNTIKTNNFNKIYEEISNHNYPVPMHMVKKVMDISYEITTQKKFPLNAIYGDVQHVEQLEPTEYLFGLISKKSVIQIYRSVSQLLEEFSININDTMSDDEKLEVIINLEKMQIRPNQYVQVGYLIKYMEEELQITEEQRNRINELKEQQKRKIQETISTLNNCNIYYSISEILEDENCNKLNNILFNTYNGNIELEDLKNYLKGRTNYKAEIKLYTMYDYLKHEII